MSIEDIPSSRPSESAGHTTFRPLSRASGSQPPRHETDRQSTVIRRDIPIDRHVFPDRTGKSIARRSLERWFDARGLRPRIVAEFHDSAPMEAFGREGAGVFAAPSAIANEICREYDVRGIGSTEAIRESSYAITIERRVKHPDVIRITENARANLFGILGSPARGERKQGNSYDTKSGSRESGTRPDGA